MLIGKILEKKLEIFANCLICVFLLLGTFLLLAKFVHWPTYYSPNFFGVNFIVSALLLYSFRYAYRIKDECKKESMIIIRTALGIALTLNFLGELFFYQLYHEGFQYDKLIHVSNSLIFFISLVYINISWRKGSLLSSIRSAAWLVFLGGIAWELFEFSSDFFFKTREFGFYGQYKFVDTSFDLISDILGIALGSALLSLPFWREKIKRLASFCISIKAGSGKERLEI